MTIWHRLLYFSQDITLCPRWVRRALERKLRRMRQYSDELP